MSLKKGPIKTIYITINTTLCNNILLNVLNLHSENSLKRSIYCCKSVVDTSILLIS